MIDEEPLHIAQSEQLQSVVVNEENRYIGRLTRK